MYRGPCEGRATAASAGLELAYLGNLTAQNPFTPARLQYQLFFLLISESTLFTLADEKLEAFCFYREPILVTQLIQDAWGEWSATVGRKGEGWDVLCHSGKTSNRSETRACHSSSLSHDFHKMGTDVSKFPPGSMMDG